MAITLSCKSTDSVDAKDPVRMRSAKPDWQKSQVRFIKNFKAKDQKMGLPSFSSSSSSCPSSPYQSFSSSLSTVSPSTALVEMDSDGPDNFTRRQEYLRTAYTFTKEEKGEKKKKGFWRKITQSMTLSFKAKKKEEKEKGQWKGWKDNLNNNDDVTKFDGFFSRFFSLCVGNVDVNFMSGVLIL